MSAAAELGRDRPIKVLVVIPTLDIGGAEMDVMRNLPRLDRGRFKIVVRTFLARGRLAAALAEAGIEVVGPLQPRPRQRKTWAWLAAMKPRTRLLAAARHTRLLLTRGARVLPRPLRSAGRRARDLLRTRGGQRAIDFLRAWRYAFAFIAIPFPGPGRAAFAYLRAASDVAAYMRDAKIDVVHAILPNAYAVAAIACIMTRLPLVMSRVSLNWYQDQTRTFGAIERQIFHRVPAAVICNSSAIRTDLLREGVPAARIELIRNGIDPDMFLRLGLTRDEARGRLGIASDAILLTVVGNHFPYKGHTDLLHALHLVRDKLPPGWLLLAPGRDVAGNLGRAQCLADDLGLSRNVRLLGERDDVPAILLAADIHLSASHTEGFPNNILEAMCAGLPVIATDVGGVSELIVHDETGVLVPVRDAKAMAAALLQFANDTQLRQSLGAAGRARVLSTFSIERSAAAWERAYGRLAARRHPRGDN